MLHVLLAGTAARPSATGMAACLVNHWCIGEGTGMLIYVAGTQVVAERVGKDESEEERTKR